MCSEVVPAYKVSFTNFDGERQWLLCSLDSSAKFLKHSQECRGFKDVVIEDYKEASNENT